MGAHFKALDEGVLMAVLKSFENFLAISKLAAALWTLFKLQICRQCGTDLCPHRPCRAMIIFKTIISNIGVKHLKRQILTLDVKIWCWTSIWRFLTSNINFWRPKSNIWRPTSIFDVLRQIWRQYLMSSINIWCWTSNIWCWTSNIDARFDVGRQKLMLDVKYLT